MSSEEITSNFTFDKIWGDKVQSMMSPTPESTSKEVIDAMELDDEKSIDFGNIMENPDTIKDNVNHPSHYNHSKIECIDAMEEALGTEAVMSFCKCNAFKYIWRSDFKNGPEDIKKAQWYINKYVELLEKSSKL